MTILCYGDSNTFGYDPRSFFGARYDIPWPERVGELTSWSVHNNGICGQRVPAHKAGFRTDGDLILVMLGTNDLLSGDAPDAIARRMERFLADADRARTVLVAPPPLCRGEWVADDNLVCSSKELAGAYRAVCERLGIRFLDAGQWSIPLCYDGVHFTEDGHRLFAGQIVSALQKACCNLSNSDI